jgi:hypothetical protein
MAATMQGVILGTAAYMSPEQVRGRAADNQQVVTNADQLLAPSLSTLSSGFATICHN